MTIRLAKILCVIDLTPFSNPALHHAVELARRFDGRLYVLHAVFKVRDPLYGTTLFDRGGEQSHRMRKAREAIAQLMEAYPLDWRPVVRVGDPVDVAARVAREFDVDLVVAASRNYSLFKRLLMGTVVERMARVLTRPLLVVRPARRAAATPTPVIKQVAVGCSADPAADPAVRYAVGLVQVLQAHLDLVHAMEFPFNEELINPDTLPYPSAQAELQKRLSRFLVEHVPPQALRDGEIGLHLATGVPAEALLRFADRKPPDLIVVGVRRHPALEKLLVGSTTETMLRRAPCPVLVVPPAAGVVAVPAKAGRSRGQASTGVVRDDHYLLHQPPEGHPERHSRLEAVYRMLDDLTEAGTTVPIVPRAARNEELLWAHAPEYLAKVVATASKEGASLAPDTPTSAASFAVARLAVGGVFTAIARVLDGELRNAFALVRPPGHHAEKSRAMGYCIFNNVALGALFARRRYGLHKIMIVDWDVHHGNGTQHIFEADPGVLFFSVHQHPHFPGTGMFIETGRGAGEGFTVNVPLPRGYGDGEYVALFEQLLRPVALEFGPDLVLVSAGFDTHRKDPLGGMRMSAAGFGGLTRSLMRIAAECCQERLVLVLEGGYHAAALARSVRSVLHELCGAAVSDLEALQAGADPRKVNYALKRALHVHRRYWHALRED